MLVDPMTSRIDYFETAEYEKARARLSVAAAKDKAIRIVDIAERGYPLRRDTLSSPMQVFLEITKRCNGACVHCYAGAGPEATDPLTFDEIAALLRQLAELGAFFVRLTGGEPTQREDFLAIVDVILEERMIPSVNTNGLFDGRTLCDMLHRGLRDLRISLDGPERVNDRIRGLGAHGKVMATLERIAEHNQSATNPADTTINAVLMKSNRHCIRGLVELAARLSFKLSFGLLRPAGRASREEMLSPAEVAAAAFEVQRLREELDLAPARVRMNFDVFCDQPMVPERRPYPADNSRCPFATQGLGISAEGRIVPCNYLASLGDGQWLGEDVRGADLLELWQMSEVLNRARQARRTRCKGCQYHVLRCNGGCPATAYAITGDIDGRDPYCVRDVDLDGRASWRQGAEHPPVSSVRRSPTVGDSVEIYQ